MRRQVCFALLVGLAGCGSDEPSAVPEPPEPPPPPVAGPPCGDGAVVQDITGEVIPADAKTYRMLPFTVEAGTERIEVSYRWANKPGNPPQTPASATVLDLGLWDARGPRDSAGFRGWGGSRVGRSEDAPAYVEADTAARGFVPGAIEPGTWHVDLGIAAVIEPEGATYAVRIKQCAPGAGIRPADDRVDARHVVTGSGPGWYHGDFHMHAYHSANNAPDWPEFVRMARDGQLDFLMVTEYVTGRHWDTLGAVQRANPDLVIWPGREIITYYGHVNTHGETFNHFEYRHGFEDVTLGGIQAQAKAAGALFQINHPRIFPPPLFAALCRGCYFELEDAIDWAQVDTLEILTGPVRATADDVGQSFPGQIENPFMQPAIDYWEEHLLQGHKITAVSGSDYKGNDPDDADRVGYGSSATAVYAANLSRAALTEGIRAGRAYVKTRGADESPELEFTATRAGTTVMFGGTLAAGPTDPVALRTVVRNAAGQILRYVRNGETFLEVPVASSPFEHSLTVTRTPGEGPLGTFWRIETYDDEGRSAIGNPIFLKGS